MEFYTTRHTISTQHNKLSNLTHFIDMSGANILGGIIRRYSRIKILTHKKLTLIRNLVQKKQLECGSPSTTKDHLINTMRMMASSTDIHSVHQCTALPLLNAAPKLANLGSFRFCYSCLRTRRPRCDVLAESYDIEQGAICNHC